MRTIAMEKMVLETVQWSQLPDIDDVKPLNDDDFDVLDEIGAILRKRGYEERFGVCLLHRHFDLAENEKLVETTDSDNRISTTKVGHYDGPNSNTIETMWRFPKGIESVTECETVCHYSGGHKSRHKIVGR